MYQVHLKLLNKLISTNATLLSAQFIALTYIVFKQFCPWIYEETSFAGPFLKFCLINGLENERQSNVCLMFVKPNLGIEEDPRGCDAGSGTLYRVSLLMAFLLLPFFVIEEKYI